MNIMVVDDEEDVQLLFQQKFRKEIRAGKIEILFSLSAEAAIQYLQEREHVSVVLILSDINMPGMNGLELLKIIKQSFPEIKVFMITAYEDERNYETALKYGADDYVSKPVNFEELKQKIFGLELTT